MARKPKKLEFDCHLPNLLAEVLSNQTCSVLVTPINITRGLLAELAQLAIEIDDDRLHIMMLRLGLYECSASDRVKQIKLLKRKIFSGKNAPVRISPNKNKYSAHEKKSKISH